MLLVQIRQLVFVTVFRKQEMEDFIKLISFELQLRMFLKKITKKFP